MSDNNSASGAKMVFGKTDTTNTEQKANSNSPVEETGAENAPNVSSNVSDVNNAYVDDRELDMPYVQKSSVTIALVKSYSLFRRANDKVLPKRNDYIGSSVNSSRILSANRIETEAYFPNIIGIASNNPDFVSRVKQYLNNIRITVNELGKQLDTSFHFNTKRDYLYIKAKEDKIEEDYNKTPRRTVVEIRDALATKIAAINELESSKCTLGSPLNVEEYIAYRHCLLYKDVAKDVGLINSDSSIRFYFKDDAKEAEKAAKFRAEINKAKVNFVHALADDTLFDSIYIQFCVATNQPVISSLAEDKLIRETKLDTYSTQEPVKFNKLFNNKDAKLIGSIEILIARGELLRSQYNQNISTGDGTFIGSNMKEAVNWFKHPDNAQIVDAYNNKLRNF